MNHETGEALREEIDHASFLHYWYEIMKSYRQQKNRNKHEYLSSRCFNEIKKKLQQFKTKI